MRSFVGLFLFQLIVFGVGLLMLDSSGTVFKICLGTAFLFFMGWAVWLVHELSVTLQSKSVWAYLLIFFVPLVGFFAPILLCKRVLDEGKARHQPVRMFPPAVSEMLSGAFCILVGAAILWFVSAGDYRDWKLRREGFFDTGHITMGIRTRHSVNLIPTGSSYAFDVEFAGNVKRLEVSEKLFHQHADGDTFRKDPLPVVFFKDDPANFELREMLGKRGIVGYLVGGFFACVGLASLIALRRKRHRNIPMTSSFTTSPAH